MATTSTRAERDHGRTRYAPPTLMTMATNTNNNNTSGHHTATAGMGVVPTPPQPQPQPQVSLTLAAALALPPPPTPPLRPRPSYGLIGRGSSRRIWADMDVSDLTMDTDLQYDEEVLDRRGGGNNNSSWDYHLHHHHHRNHLQQRQTTTGSGNRRNLKPPPPSSLVVSPAAAVAAATSPPTLPLDDEPEIGAAAAAVAAAADAAAAATPPSLLHSATSGTRFSIWKADNHEWKCSKCTFINQNSLYLTCEVCGEARISETVINGDTENDNPQNNEELEDDTKPPFTTLADRNSGIRSDRNSGIRSSSSSRSSHHSQNKKKSPEPADLSGSLSDLLQATDMVNGTATFGVGVIVDDDDDDDQKHHHHHHTNEEDDDDDDHEQCRLRTSRRVQMEERALLDQRMAEIVQMQYKIMEEIHKQQQQQQQPPRRFPNNMNDDVDHDYDQIPPIREIALQAQESIRHIEEIRRQERDELLQIEIELRNSSKTGITSGVTTSTGIGSAGAGVEQATILTDEERRAQEQMLRKWRRQYQEREEEMERIREFQQRLWDEAQRQQQQQQHYYR